MRSQLYPTRVLHNPRVDRAIVVSRVARVIDYLFGIVYAVLLVRLGLEFFGANPRAGFVQLVDRVSDPLYGPFKGIFATSNVEGAHIVWPLLVAILAYMVLHGLVRGLLRLIANP